METGKESRADWERERRQLGERVGRGDPSAGGERMHGGRGLYVPRPPRISSTPVEESLFCVWYFTLTISLRRCKGNKLFSELQVFRQVFFQRGDYEAMGVQGRQTFNLV